MDNSPALQLIIILILLALSAFFSSSETALTTVSHLKLRSLADDGNKKAKKELRQREIRDRQKQIIRARQRQQLLRENQDKSNNWKRIHGLPATRKKR